MSHFMDGDVGYSPRSNGGSTFWLQLNATVSRYQDKYANGEAMTIDKRQRRIIVAESDLARQSVLLGNLKSLDCVVTCVSSFSDLEMALESAAFDAIVVGLELEDRAVEFVSSEVVTMVSTASMTPVVRLSTELSGEIFNAETEVLVSMPIQQSVLRSGLDAAISESRDLTTGMRRTI
jgi:CheY-like chemotaxis protein